MTVYIIFLALLFSVKWLQNRIGTQGNGLYFLALFITFAFCAFRFEVGCDWTGYLNQWRLVEFGNDNAAFGAREWLWWAVLEALEASGVDKDYRGREKASDHAPTWVQLRAAEA